MEGLTNIPDLMELHVKTHINCHVGATEPTTWLIKRTDGRFHGLPLIGTGETLKGSEVFKMLAELSLWKGKIAEVESQLIKLLNDAATQASGGSRPT